MSSVFVLKLGDQFASAYNGIVKSLLLLQIVPVFVFIIQNLLL